MSESATNVFFTAGREVYCWAEQQASVMLKSVTPHGDPVELTAIEARALAAELMRLAEQIEK